MENASEGARKEARKAARMPLGLPRCGPTWVRMATAEWGESGRTLVLGEDTVRHVPNLLTQCFIIKGGDGTYK